MNSFKSSYFSVSGKRWKTYQSIIDIDSDLYKKVKSQAEKKIHFSPNASQGGSYRSLDIKYQNQLRGGLAEAYSKILIEEYAHNKSRKIKVERYDDVLTSTTGFTYETIKGEYDIKVFVGNNTKILESRSSVSHSISISDAIERYDTIGRYTSLSKPDESNNDYYIRPLYEYVDYRKKNFYKLDFETLLKNDKIKLHFVGGTDFNLMKEKGYNKSMGQGSTSYRVVKILKGYTIDEFLDKLIEI